MRFLFQNYMLVLHDSNIIFNTYMIGFIIIGWWGSSFSGYCHVAFRPGKGSWSPTLVTNPILCTRLYLLNSMLLMYIELCISICFGDTENWTCQEHEL